MVSGSEYAILLLGLAGSIAVGVVAAIVTLVRGKK
jgi:hypothetical protein